MKNKVNKKYFLLSLKREIPFMIFNLVVFSLSYLLPLGFNGGFSTIEEVSSYRYRYNLSTYYGFLLFVFAVYAVIIPIKTFIFFKMLMRHHFSHLFHQITSFSQISMLAYINPSSLEWITDDALALGY